MKPEDRVVLENDFDKQVFEFGLKVGKTFLKYNPDLKPTISFYFDKKDPNKRVLMFPKNEDCTTFLASLDAQLHAYKYSRLILLYSPLIPLHML